MSRRRAGRDLAPTAGREVAPTAGRSAAPTALAGAVALAASSALAGLTLAALPGPAAGQHDPRVEPAPAYAVTGATVHTLAGSAVENGVVVVRDGRVEAVGSAAQVQVPQDARVIDAGGLHVYPGMLDAFSRLGLTEIGQVTVSNDVSELGRYKPHLQAAAAVHPASEHIPVARANGITHALTAPGGGVIPGQAALIHLDGWTVEEMAVETSAALILDWPGIQTRSFDFSTFTVRERPYSEAKKEYDERVEELEGWFEAARHYRQAVTEGDPARVERDLQLEHLARVLDGGLRVIVQTNDRLGIEDAVAFGERWGLEVVLAGAREARPLKDMLAEKRIPVILGPTQTLPSDEDDPYHYPLSLAGELHEAGVEIAFATFNSSDSRTLPYEAANAVPFGLPREAALRAVTVNAARMLGVEDRLGTLEPGKAANLIVTDGDPLEIQTRIEWVFIRGAPVDLANRHDRLWERHRARPAPEEGS